MASQRTALQFGRHWTDDEISKLCEYVGENGPVNWKAVAEYIGTRKKANGCRQRWFDFHSPGVKTGEFTPVEKLNALLLHSKLKENSWSKIAKELPGRTPNRVKNFCNQTVKKEGRDYPIGMIKRLVKGIEAEAEGNYTVESCLLSSAYDEFLRLFPGRYGVRTVASSSTAGAYYPQGPIIDSPLNTVFDVNVDDFLLEFDGQELGLPSRAPP